MDVAFFDRKAQEWRMEQSRILNRIQQHQSANQSYMDEGFRLLEVGRRTHELFEEQTPVEKRKLLDFVLSNSTWKGGLLSATLKQPFDLLADGKDAAEERARLEGRESTQKEDWLPGMDSNHDSRLQRPLSYH